jgi:hypothetical protein
MIADLIIPVSLVLVPLFLLVKFFRKKGEEDVKEIVFNEIQRVSGSITAYELGDNLQIPDSLIYKAADELVREHRIGKTVTRGVVQNRPIRRVCYHPVIGVSTRTTL